MPAEPTDADYAALAEFRFALRNFQAFSEKRAAECGLTPQQHQALLVIRAARDEPTVGYVAERLILKPHSATGLIDRLVALGLIERQASSKDKRQAILALTGEARTVLRQLSVTHREEVRRLRPLLDALLKRLDDKD
ncbi:MarR family transcriptional regulator [Novosphingobium flavum]|uniref:MarR family transcriptional regulator n=1 Tax=Novosphingobium flavum TaxID=1778672 RepID=A0A7X1FQW8_9SPHN|nr:helix-turn-helix domain-containing protein [Novosphingobium flavum]MBC2665314.1 MarR family transcriptional regulator [Novosphingobium flavum]